MLTDIQKAEIAAQVRAIWQSSEPNWMKLARFKALNPGQWEVFGFTIPSILGLTFSQFYTDWWRRASAAEGIRYYYFDSPGLLQFQRSTSIRFVQENAQVTPPYSDQEAADAVGLTLEEWQAWVSLGDAGFSRSVRTVLALSIPEVVKATFLRSLAYDYGLAVDDLVRLSGLSATAINALLPKAVAQIWGGNYLVVQPTANTPGIASEPAITGTVSLIPAGSDPIAEMAPAGASGTIVRTITGYQVPLPDVATFIQRIPLNAAGIGWEIAAQLNPMINDRDKAIALRDWLARFGETLDYFQRPGQLIMYTREEWARFLNLASLGDEDFAAVMSIEDIGLQMPSWEGDQPHWQVFADIFAGPDLLQDKATAWITYARPQGLSVDDISRIVGVDLRSVRQFLKLSPLWESTYGAVVLTGAFEIIDSAPVTDVPDYYAVAQSNVAETLSDAYVEAVSPGGIGFDAMQDNIRAFVRDAGNKYAAVVEGMQTWGVSLDDIRAALAGLGYEAWIAGLINYIANPPPPITLRVETETTSPVTLTVTTDLTQVKDSAVTQPTTVLVDSALDVVDLTNETARGEQTMALSVPDDLDTYDEQGKINWYRVARAAGFTDAYVRAAVEAKFGVQSDADWAYLTSAAAAAAAAGGGGAAAGGGAQGVQAAVPIAIGLIAALSLLG